MILKIQKKVADYSHYGKMLSTNKQIHRRKSAVTTVSNKEDFDNAIFECCMPFFKRFNINGILRRFYAVKQKGVSAYVTFLFLIGLVFTGKNLYTLLKTEPERLDFEKDVVYRFLGDSRQ